MLYTCARSCCNEGVAMREGPESSDNSSTNASGNKPVWPLKLN